MKIPGAILAYRLLCLWVAVCQLGLITLGVWLQTFQPPPGTDPESVKALGPLGLLLIPLGVTFFFANAYLAFAKPKPWMWVAGITNIIGAVIFCPISFVLLLPWYRPEVKQYFDPEGRYLN